MNSVLSDHDATNFPVKIQRSDLAKEKKIPQIDQLILSVLNG